MALPEYPASDFPGTPPLATWAIERGMERVGVVKNKWRIPLQIIGRFETDFDTYIQNTALSPCPKCRGMMQCSDLMYALCWQRGYIQAVDYTHPVQAVQVALHYCLSHLAPSYGGYGNVKTLIDERLSEVIEAWQANPSWGYQKLRPYYHGY